MNEIEKEEPGISKEFSLEIEKYSNLEGVTSEEFIQQATKDHLEKLKRIYADKKPKMDFHEYNEKISDKAVRMYEEIVHLEEKLSDFLLEQSYELGAYHEGAPIPPDETQNKKISFKEYFENIVGPIAKMREEINRKQDELDKFVLDFIQKYGVKKEESVALCFCPNDCGTRLVKHTFIDVLSEPENSVEDLYCQKCGIRWIAEQHSPLKTEETKTENKLQKIDGIMTQVALCPNGCGTVLGKGKFIDAHDLDLVINPADNTIDLYCTKCGIRWIAENNNYSKRLMTAQERTKPIYAETKPEIKTEKIELAIPTGEMALLQQMAKDKGKDANQVLSQIINEKIAEDKREPMTYEENGVVYERLFIDLPQKVVNFYRYQAHAKDLNDHVETLIAIDVCDSLKATIEGNAPDDWKDLFNLGPDFTDMEKRENKIKSQTAKATI